VLGIQTHHALREVNRYERSALVDVRLARAHGLSIGEPIVFREDEVVLGGMVVEELKDLTAKYVHARVQCKDVVFGTSLQPDCGAARARQQGEFLF
jgi:hypothetical protein